jgi:hypothetical protein
MPVFSDFLMTAGALTDKIFMWLNIKEKWGNQNSVNLTILKL